MAHVQRRWWSAFVVGIVVGCAPGLAAAEAAARSEGDPVLQQLIGEAVARSPEIRAAEAALAAARAGAAVAGARPDPMLSVTYTNDGWAPSLGTMGMTTLGIMVGQEFLYPGKRERRAAAAAADARLLEPRLTRLRLSLAAEVTRAYFGLVLSRELQALVAEQRGLWTQIEAVVRARYSVGQGTQQDVLRVQVEMTRIEQRIVEQAVETELWTSEINRLLGRPLEMEVATPARLTIVPIDGSIESVTAQAVAQSPELDAARKAVDATRAARDEALGEFKPDFVVQGGYMNRGGLAPMWVAGLGVSIPSSAQRREQVSRRADALATASIHGVDAVERQLRLRTHQRFLRARAVERLVAIYDEGILAQNGLTLESALAGYQTDRGSFVAVLDAMNTLFGDRLARAALVGEHARLRADLAELRLDAPDMSTFSTGSAGATTDMSGGGMSGTMGRR